MSSLSGGSFLVSLLGVPGTLPVEEVRYMRYASTTTLLCRFLR